MRRSHTFAADIFRPRGLGAALFLLGALVVRFAAFFAVVLRAVFGARLGAARFADFFAAVFRPAPLTCRMRRH